MGRACVLHPYYTVKWEKKLVKKPLYAASYYKSINPYSDKQRLFYSAVHNVVLSLSCYNYDNKEIN